MQRHPLARELCALAAKMTDEQSSRLLSHPAVAMTYESASEDDDATPSSVQDLIDSAHRHGLESEPEMEDGDLEAYLDAAKLILGIDG